MRRLTMLLGVVCVMMGCAGADEEAPAPDASPDAIMADASVDAPGDEARDDDSASCICTGQSACCDGCWPRVNTRCETGSVCFPDGVCDDRGECWPSPRGVCDELVEERQCQAAVCDELEGCSVRPVREGIPCDDGRPGTRGDRCVAGACVGRCEASDGPCCVDGALITGECPLDAQGRARYLYQRMCGEPDDVGFSLPVSARAWRYQCDGFNTTCSLPDVTKPPVIDRANRGCYYGPDVDAETWCAKTEDNVWLTESELSNHYCALW